MVRKDKSSVVKQIYNEQLDWRECTVQYNGLKKNIWVAKRTGNKYSETAQKQCRVKSNS